MLKTKTELDQPIRVMLVDDHMMIRQGLATLIKVCDDIELAGEAASGSEAIDICDRVIPDVILMDIVMPEMDGVTATRVIRQKHPGIKIVALSSYLDEALVVNTLQAGAIGYLLKNISSNDLIQAIRTAYNGRATLSPEATQVMVQATNQGPIPGHDLTDRERAVLSLMVEGCNNPQIAARLVISPSTVKSHVSNILSKLNATCRTEAVAISVKYGLTG
jgi:two-component system, NarL family, response regulator LiaR